MEMTKNWNSKDVEPGFLFFKAYFPGYWALVPAGSTLVFVGFTFWGYSVGLDILSILFIGLIIFSVPSAFVMLLVNDRPRTYVADLYKWYKFRILTCLYMKGFLDRPPYLWIKGKTPPYPR